MTALLTHDERMTTTHPNKTVADKLARPRLLSHLRRNAVAYLAITMTFVVAPTTAYAVATIRSEDIVDGEVKTADLARNAVRSWHLKDGVVRSDDVQDESLVGTDITGLTGLDIEENTLGQVPLATSALSGGTGRSGGNGSANCDPESTTFLTCTSLGLTLATPGRVLIIASAVGRAELDADSGQGTCRVGTSVTGPIPGSSVFARTRDGLAYPSVVGVTPVLAAGPVSVGLDCNQDQAFGAIVFDDVRIAAVALSSN